MGGNSSLGLKAAVDTSSQIIFKSEKIKQRREDLKAQANIL